MKHTLTFCVLAIVAGAFCLTQARQAISGNFGAFSDRKDIGITPKAGSDEYDPATKEYRVTGGGANIWGKADAFQFVYTNCPAT